MLRFLIRSMFWLTLIILLAPVDSGQEGVNTNAALQTVHRFVADIAGFCERNPQTCETAARFGESFLHKAEAGARTLYQFGRDQFAPEPPADTLSSDDDALRAPLPPATPPD